VFGNHVVGRITRIVPFFPFEDAEAAVVAHKYVLQLQDDVKKPVQLAQNRLIGDIQLKVREDGKM